LFILAPPPPCNFSVKTKSKLFLWVGLSISMLKYWKLPSYNISNQIFSINLELIRPEKQYSLSNSNSFKCLKIQFPHHMMIPNLCNQHILCFIFCSLFENVKVFKKKICDFSTTNKTTPLKNKILSRKNHRLIIRDVVHELKTRAQKTNPWERLT